MPIRRLAILLRSNQSTALLNLATEELKLDPASKNIEPVDQSRRTTDVKKGIQSAHDLGLTDELKPVLGVPLQSANTDSTNSAQIWSRAELALFNDPLNARALRILGQLSQSRSEEGQTKALMQAAARRSFQESIAVYWMMQKSYQDQDYREALRYIDMLFRTRQQLMRKIGATIRSNRERSPGERRTKTVFSPIIHRGGSRFCFISPAMSRTHVHPSIYFSVLRIPRTRRRCGAFRLSRFSVRASRFLRPSLLYLAAISSCGAARKSWPSIQWQLRGHSHWTCRLIGSSARDRESRFKSRQGPIRAR